MKIGKWLPNILEPIVARKWLLVSIFLGILLFVSVYAVLVSERRPILHLAQSDAPDPVEVGKTLVYHITYSNTGQAAAHGVFITDTFDMNVTPIAFSQPPHTIDSRQGSWNIGQVKANSSGDVVITVTVNSSLTTSLKLSNQVKISSDELQAIEDRELTRVIGVPVLSISQVDPPDRVGPGGILIYRLTYSNTGTAAATQASVYDEFDPNVMFDAGNCAPVPSMLGPRLALWNIGKLEVGEQGMIECSVQVTDTVLGFAVLNNAAWIQSHETDKVEAHTKTVLNSPGVLCNGDFEMGDLSCWIKIAAPNFPVDVVRPLTDPNYNCFDTYAVRIGNSGWVPNGKLATGRYGIAQTVQVSDIPYPKLEFDYCMYSYDVMEGPFSRDIYDIFAIAVNDLYTYTWRTGNPGPNLGNPWMSEPSRKAIRQSIDLSDYRGKTVTLFFLVWNQIYPELNTWVYIDNIDGDFAR